MRGGGARADLGEALRAVARRPASSAAVACVTAAALAGSLPLLGLLRLRPVFPPRLAPALLPAPFREPGWELPWGAEAAGTRGVAAVQLGELLTALAVAAAATLVLGSAAAWALSAGRSRARSRELGTRSAVGAARRRLRRQLLFEGALLAGAGTLVGLLAATGADRVLSASLPAGLVPVGAGPTALAPWPALAATIPVAAVLRAAASPVRAPGEARRPLGPTSLMRPEGRGLGDLMVGGLVALILPLVTASALAVRSYAPAGEHVRLPPRARDTALLELNLPADNAMEAPDRAEGLGALLEELGRVPGVEAAGLSTPGAWAGRGVVDRARVECRCSRGGVFVPWVVPYVRHAGVSPGFFRVLGVPLLEGSGLGAGRPGAAGAGVLVNRSLAGRVLAGTDAPGKRVVAPRGSGRTAGTRIAGVVEDLAAGGPGTRRPVPTVFLPLDQRPPRRLDLLVRTRGDPRATAGGIRGAVRAALPGAGVTFAGRLEEALRRIRGPLDWLAGLFLLAGLAAVAVGSGGVHAAAADEMRRRRRELGVRRAVGARRRDVAALVLRWTGRAAGAGLVAGLVGALPVAAGLRLLLPGVRVADPLVWAGVPAVLAAVTAAGALGPAIRTARMAPFEAAEAS